MSQVNNEDTRTMQCRSGVFIANFEHISQLVLVFLLLILSKCQLGDLEVILQLNSVFYFYTP